MSEKILNNTKIYGTNPETGTISICRAKPENRGKGKCHHVNHVKLTDFTNKDVQNYNEKKLEEFYLKKQKSLTKQDLDNNNFNLNDFVPDNVSATKIQSHNNGAVISDKDLNKGTIDISNNFENLDYRLIKDFYEKFERRMSNNQLNEVYDKPSKNIEEYLRSEDETAIKIREFLGKDVDLENFSKIITVNVNSMTAVLRWKNETKNNPPRRAILSALKNDMTKERYIASIMFFGGRCCYCNKVLYQSVSENSANKATGEHITPLSPDDSDDVSGCTRYGNMALACFKCNHDRGNKNLEKWMKETKTVPEENKKAVLNRIKAFRQFALYKDFTKQESDLINSKIKEVVNLVNSFQKNKETKRFDEEDAEKIKSKINETIEFLKLEIN